MVNIENLIRLAVLVRDETGNKQNTALRVGGTLLELVNALQEIIGMIEDVDEGLTESNTRTRHLKGITNDPDALYETSSLGLYGVWGGGWRGSLSVQFDALSNVSQVALSSSTPSYDGNTLTWLSAKPCVMVRTYTNGTWSQWELLSGGDASITIASDGLGDLDISDALGYVLARFEKGHFRTKNFYSGDVYTKRQVDSLIPTDYYTKAQTYTKQQVNNLLPTDYYPKAQTYTRSEIESLIGSGGVTPVSPTTRTIKILAVGNSYAADAFMYFPYVFRNILPDVNLVIGIASIGSCTVQMHLDKATNNTADYYYYKWTVSAGKWTSSSGKTLQYIVQDEEWDIVTFQQKSTNSADYSTISPYLNPLIDWLFAKVGRAIKVGWLMTPALPRGNSGLQPYNYSSDTFYASLVTTAQSILTNTPVSFVIPEATAIQNCRKTSLNDLGDYQYNYMTQDGVHLQQGLPCLVASYLCVQYILDMIGYANKGILGDDIRPTDALDETWNILSQQGNCVGVTNANCLLAQKCVMMAIKKPWEITNCGNLYES